LMEGNFRDEDGVDRVKECPDELKPLLLVLKEKAIGEGIDLAGEFQDAGASCYGTMSKGQFSGQLVKTFKRFHFTDALLAQITDAYGTGLPDHKWGGFKEVAWMDFVEDVTKMEGSAATSVGSVSIGGAFGGKSRDEDGTIDRVPDPPEALKKFLLVFKRKNFNAGIDVMGALRGAGASPNGTMKVSERASGRVGNAVPRLLPHVVLADHAPLRSCSSCFASKRPTRSSLSASSSSTRSPMPMVAAILTR